LWVKLIVLYRPRSVATLFLVLLGVIIIVIIIIIIIIIISGNRNVIKKEAEKILKYKDLTIEIQRMWNVKTKVIPIIIGTTGTV
jgi:hypothetical protein